jgi:hypothetical protein
MENVKIPRRFDFARDRFAFANELLWHYELNPATGRMDFRPRQPKPDYTHRCFVLVRAARQFLYHARWEADAGLAIDDARQANDDDYYRQLVRRVISRSARIPAEPGNEVVFPGYANLFEFSSACESLLKAECGKAWRSYVQRSHWRMVLPIGRNHQQTTARRLGAALEAKICPIIHLVTFPALTINHGMIVFDARDNEAGTEFTAYDPNDPATPTCLQFDRARKTFLLPPNRYWAGGALNVIQIYRNWWI